MKVRKRTQLGRALAKLRIDFDENAASTMAKKIGVSPSQLHNIENGLGTITLDFIAAIQKHYGLDISEIVLAGGSMAKVTIDLDELTEEDRRIVINIWSRSKNIPDILQPCESAKITETQPKRVENMKPGPRVVKIDGTEPRRAPNLVDDGVGFLDEEEDAALAHIESVELL